MPYTTTVIRDGDQKEIESSLLVPGDIVALKPGDKIPADLRIINERKLHKTLIAGEKQSQEEKTQSNHEKCFIEDENFEFLGSPACQSGKKGIVILTGDKNSLGTFIKYSV
jgi:P-type E1-E2 ATPase